MMQIVLLSGGSGQRLWPLSNGTRSKQFLHLLPAPDGGRESMIKRVARQLNLVFPEARLTVATLASQQDAVRNELGPDVNIVAEPQRRDTFPAISLACAWLNDVAGVDPEEPVVVVPCDTFADNNYFLSIRDMLHSLETTGSDLILMGVRPAAISDDYGYIIPQTTPTPEDVESRKGVPVARFIEKPTLGEAERLFAGGAFCNGGIFVFRLRFMLEQLGELLPGAGFETLSANYSHLPKTSFDFQVAEQTSGMRMVPAPGCWKDLGNWGALAEEMAEEALGTVHVEKAPGTTVINELNIPLMAFGCEGLVIAASPDGILVADKEKANDIKPEVQKLGARPMYEERRWGEYKVLDTVQFADGFSILTKQLRLNPGCSLSYQKHSCRSEVWTFVDGKGTIVLDGIRRPVGRGDVVNIASGQMHALKAETPLTFIEVQQGTNLVEEDIERFPYDWE